MNKQGLVEAVAKRLECSRARAAELVDVIFSSGGVIAGGAVEIRNGMPVARVNLLLQFVTSRVLHKQLDALGDTSTVRTVYNTVTKGIPWQGCPQPISAPAALIKDVDVITWDVTT